MYEVQCRIRGVAPLLQHRLSPETQTKMEQRGKKFTAAPDWKHEWRLALYHDPEKNIVWQPAEAILQAMTRASASIKVPGRGKQTYKDLFKSVLLIEPIQIPHETVTFEDFNKAEENGGAYGNAVIDARPVVVNRSRVIRYRPMIREGWKLSFTVRVLEDDLAPEVVQEALEYAGHFIGIGDFRPRFGRFVVERFELTK